MLSLREINNRQTSKLLYLLHVCCKLNLGLSFFFFPLNILFGFILCFSVWGFFFFFAKEKGQIYEVYANIKIHKKEREIFVHAGKVASIGKCYWASIIHDHLCCVDWTYKDSWSNLRSNKDLPILNCFILHSVDLCLIFHEKLSRYSQLQLNKKVSIFAYREITWLFRRQVLLFLSE